MGKKTKKRKKLNLFGDSALQVLNRILGGSESIDIGYRMFIKKGTLMWFFQKLRHTYNRKPYWSWKTFCTALVAAGTYDVIRFRNNPEATQEAYLKKMKKSFKSFVCLLRERHSKIVILTVPPLSSFNESQLRLTDEFNRYLESLSDSKKVTVVDASRMYLPRKSQEPSREGQQGGDVAGGGAAAAEATATPTPTPTPTEADADAETDPMLPVEISENLNHTGIAEIAVRIINEVKRETLVNAHKLQASNVENKIKEVGEACGERSIISSKAEDVCLADDRSQCSAVRYLAGNSIVDRNVGKPIKQGKKPYSYVSKMDASPNSMYNANTFHLNSELKQRLSWIRFTDYTSYGEELLRGNKLKSVEKELVSVATYNVLSQELLEKHNYLYASHDRVSLEWSIRSEILIEELGLLNADVFCLQEVDSRLLDPFYNRYLNSRGYDGVYKKRTHGKIDGCAIYYRKDKFALVDSSTVEFFKESVSLLNRDNIGIILKLSLRDRPEVEMVVATTHLLYNPKRADIRLAQTQVMLAEIERLAYKGTDPRTGAAEYRPILFTGDMNYTPDSAVYQLVTKSYLEYEGMSRKCLLPMNDGYALNKTLLPPTLGVTDSCQYFATLSDREGACNIKFGSGVLGHHLNLTSAYGHVKKDLPEATTGLEKWMTVDYIFYSQLCDAQMQSRSDGKLKLVSRLALPNCREAETQLVSIPNLACGSDHLPLLATFHLTGS